MTFCTNASCTGSSTYTRSTEMQIWPLLEKAHCTAMFAARSRSASRSTIIGSLPPSSSDTGISRSAACTATFRPVAVDPVKWIMSTLSTSAAPARPVPVTTENTSAGAPHSRAASPIIRFVSGVTSLGFSTTELPDINAGMQSPKLLVSG